MTGISDQLQSELSTYTSFNRENFLLQLRLSFDSPKNAGSKMKLEDFESNMAMSRLFLLTASSLSTLPLTLENFEFFCALQVDFYI